MHHLDQDILLYPGYTAGRAGGANPEAGRGTTPGPGRRVYTSGECLLLVICCPLYEFQNF